ncbi:MAG: PAS domain S-box protein [Mycobacterium leprae]
MRDPVRWDRLRPTLAYALFGMIWFYAMHWTLAPAQVHNFTSDDLVGWTFVGGSTLFIFLILSHEQRIRTKAERVSARRQETLTAIFQASTAGILLLDQQRLVRECSPAAERLLGLAKRKLVGRPIPLEPPIGLSDWVERGMAGELPDGFEVTHIRTDGSTVPLQVQMAPLPPGGEANGGLLVVLVDISRRKQAALAAQAMQRRLLAINQVGRCLAATEESVEERLSKAVGRLTPLVADWCLLDVVQNDGSLRRLSVAMGDKGKIALGERLKANDLSDEMRRSRMAELLAHPEGDLRQILGEEGAHLVPTGDPQLEDLSALGIHCSSAITVPIRVRNRTLGLITLVAAESGWKYTPDDLALAHEVAARMGAVLEGERLYADSQRAEEDARQSEIRLRAQYNLMAAVNDSMVEGVMGFDQMGRLTLVNRAAEALIGRPRAELLGQCLRDLIQCGCSGEICTEGECLVMQVIQTGVERLDRQVIFLRRDGALIPVQCAVTPIREASGGGGAVMTFAPVTLGGAVKAWRPVGDASQ